MVLAFMRSAMKRWISGEIVLSFADIWYQVGLLRQAATVVRPENSEVEMRPCTAYRMRAFTGSTSPAKYFRNDSSLSCAKPPDVTRPSLAGGRGNFIASAA